MTLLFLSARLETPARRTAITLVRRNEFINGAFDERRLRWPIGYTFDVLRLLWLPARMRFKEQIENIGDLVAIHAAHKPILLVDCSATGRAPVDAMAEQGLAPVAVQVVESGRAHRAHRTQIVPRTDLVTDLALVLGADGLAIDPELEDAKSLARQLEEYRVKPDADDRSELAIAVALAVWWGRNRARSTLLQPRPPRLPVEIRTTFTWNEAAEWADQRLAGIDS